MVSMFDDFSSALDAKPSEQIAGTKDANPSPIIVILSADNMLNYQHGTSKKSKYLRVIGELKIKVEPGCIITIGACNYFIVDEFYDEVHMISKKQLKTKKIILPTATQVIAGDGIPVALIRSLEVIIPDKCNIELFAGTKLQQVDSGTQFVLYHSTRAKFFA